MVKKCSKCGQEKDIGCFHKKTDSKDGYKHECKECTKTRNEWVYAKRTGLLVCECSTCGKRKSAFEMVKNKVGPFKRRGICKSCKNKTVQKWKESHKEQVGNYQRAYVSKRRALKVAATHPDHDPQKELAFAALARELEALTGEPYAIDHVWPLAKGGIHHHENLQVIPASWNSEKGASMEWRRTPAKHWRDLPAWLQEACQKRAGD